MTRPSRRVVASPGPSFVRRVGALTSPSSGNRASWPRPGTCDVMDHFEQATTRGRLAKARGLMPLSEICLRIAIGAFVVGLAPFSLAIFYKYLGYISASDIALMIAMATVVVAVVSLFVGIIAKVREAPPP